MLSKFKTKGLLPFTPHSAVRKGDYKLIYDWYR